ncbi:hypothetical protein GG344DRAFT_69128 [Lentinula edodes]|nr:hypothetical protein GG344DRAFT_69128 [Lentinula edodes]
MGNPVSNPELANGEYQRNKVLLYLSDVFGLQLPNAQLLVDGFAKNGIMTFEKDGLSFDVFNSEENRKARDNWTSRLAIDDAYERIDPSPIKAASRKSKITRMKGTGECCLRREPCENE